MLTGNYIVMEIPTMHLQTPDKKNNKATIVIITHKTSEINCHNCLSIFKKNKNILKIPKLIRLLG